MADVQDDVESNGSLSSSSFGGENSYSNYSNGENGTAESRNGRQEIDDNDDGENGRQENRSGARRENQAANNNNPRSSPSKKRSSPASALKLFKRLGLKNGTATSAGTDSSSAPGRRNGKAESQTDQSDRDSSLENVRVDRLPQLFYVRYLGKRPTKGLWGIKHTRGPVEQLISATRKLKPGDTLPILQLHVSEVGVHVDEVPENTNRKFESGLRPIDTISYGVQDVKYTRVFAMIAVKEDTTFECHAYVCTGRVSARKLAYSLALAFKEFGKHCGGGGHPGSGDIRGSGVEEGRRGSSDHKFAIDLRTPSEIEADLKSGVELDSEA